MKGVRGCESPKSPQATYTLATNQWRRHGVDWGGHVHPSFPRVRFSNFLKSVEKTWRGGGVDFHSL